MHNNGTVLAAIFAITLILIALALNIALLIGAAWGIYTILTTGATFWAVLWPVLFGASIISGVFVKVKVYK